MSGDCFVDTLSSANAVLGTALILQSSIVNILRSDTRLQQGDAREIVRAALVLERVSRDRDDAAGHRAVPHVGGALSLTAADWPLCTKPAPLGANPEPRVG